MPQANEGLEFISGEVAFSHLTKHEVFNNESTGKFSLVITVDDDAAKKLEGQGIELKVYDGKKQRAFKTRFKFQYVDSEKTAQEGELGRGSKVTIAYKLGEPYGDYGVSTFLQGVQVKERSQPAGSEDVFTADKATNDDLPF